jgi:geranylgeranyl diphosphate synthase type I
MEDHLNMTSSMDALLTRDIESINKGLAQTFIDFAVPSKWYEIGREHVLSGGKRVRPLICLASCRLLGGNDSNAFQAALAVELLHNASLIHDDIIDRDRIRRGRPTIAAQYDDFSALLIGDLLFSLAFKVASRYYQDPRIIRTLSESVFDMVNGGSIGVKLRDELDVNEEVYVEVAELKTAALFRASAALGAICAGMERKEFDLMSKFGTMVGVAFQIKDDILGLVGDEEETGKPTNSDLRNREKTLIAIHALKNTRGSDAEALRRFYSHDGVNGVSPEVVKEIFERSGSINYAIDKSWNLVREAKGIIADLPVGEGRNVLNYICDFAITRNK